MKNRAAALCLSLCLVFSAIPFAAAAQDGAATDSNQPITAQQPDFTVTPKESDVKDRWTIDVKADKGGSFVLRRAREKSTWENIGEARHLAAGEQTVWNNLNAKDNNGTRFQYQVVHLATVGNTSPAVTVSVDKDGKLTTTAAVVELTAEPVKEDQATKPEVSANPTASSETSEKNENTTKAIETVDKKTETDATAKDGKTTAEGSNNKKATSTVESKRTGTATATTKPSSAKKTVSTSSSRSHRPSHSTRTKSVPKTGAAGSTLPMIPMALLAAGIAVSCRKPRIK